MEKKPAHDSDGTEDAAREEPIEGLVEEVTETNPDPITRRESLEQELMEEGRSAEGAGIAVSDDDADRDG